jgi:hypothetical protein
MSVVMDVPLSGSSTSRRSHRARSFSGVKTPLTISYDVSLEVVLSKTRKGDVKTKRILQDVVGFASPGDLV